MNNQLAPGAWQDVATSPLHDKAWRPATRFIFLKWFVFAMKTIILDYVDK